MNTELWHIVPIDDLRPHEASVSCWCHPTVDEERSDVYVHHSMDQRELYESGERKPS